MKYSFDGFNYLIRLDKGECLSEVIEQFAHETKIEGTWVNGIGACQEVTLGYYDLDAKEYRWQTFEGLREVVSLSGSLASDEQGKMIFHLHGVMSDQQYKTVGGHVKDLIVGATLELFIHRAYKPTKRKHDSETGLNLLDL